ncbi:bifunctional phosphopantothenoylcysteine decarboxylase/phosphopantothenate synthase [Streptomyces sp. ADI97-07]|nr:bifunctional phosphopantothenoylcysteine decarboxylase/phosphopantothenate synthase [Streptomyces sp. ADI97-07]
MCLGLTPSAAKWLEADLPALEELTGHPVRLNYKLPGQPDAWPPADVILFAPATFNSVNHWALGLTDRFVVGVVAEAIGKEIPTVAMPCVNAAYAQHPQFHWSVDALRSMGIEVLYGEGGFVPNQPGEKLPFPWQLALDAVDAIVSPRP